MKAGSPLARSLVGALTLFASPAGLTLAAGFATAAISSTAAARQAAGYYAVVVNDGTPLRCADITGAYRVAELPKGQVVLVESETSDWARVAYPPKTGAFVRADDAQLDGSTVKLTQPSKLRAANAVSGFGASWKSLLSDPLPAGATLKLIETIKGEDGTVQGYRVVAPDAARGFIAPSALRRASDAEIAAYKKAIGAPAETKPAATTENKPSTPEAAPAPADHQPAATPDPKPADNSLLTPQTPEGATPAQPAPGQPAATPPATGDENAPTIVEQKPAQPAAAAPAAPAPKVGSLEALEASFQKVRKEPVLEAELDPLMVEIERAIGTTDKSKFPRRHAQLVQRYDYLKLQVDYRDRVRALEEARRRIDAARDQSQQRLAELEAQRVYTVIGQILPSNVYDGKDLPLMYRIQAVGGVVPRTLGYLKPQEQLQLPSKLGMVVGIIGQASIDPSLRLNIFDAVRVDVLKAADNVPPASNMAPPENPPENLPEATDAGDGAAETPQ